MMSDVNAKENRCNAITAKADPQVGKKATTAIHVLPNNMSHKLDATATKNKANAPTHKSAKHRLQTLRRGNAPLRE